MDYKYICSIITPRSGSSILGAKLKEKIEYVDIANDQFKVDYEGGLYAIGNTKDEAKIKAELILKKYQSFLLDLSELMITQNSYQH